MLAFLLFNVLGVVTRTRSGNVYSPPCGATFRQANDYLRLRRSGEPSRQVSVSHGSRLH